MTTGTQPIVIDVVPKSGWVLGPTGEFRKHHLARVTGHWGVRPGHGPTGSPVVSGRSGVVS
jgi:hypothetical protein